MKLKSKIIIKLIIAAIIMSFMTVPFSIMAYASDNDSGFSGDADKTTGKGGASYLKSGYLAYIVDKNGNLKSDVAFLYYSGNFPTGYNDTYLRSGFGEKTYSRTHVMDSSYPHPYTATNSGNVGNGEQLANMLAEYITGTTISHAAELIGSIWGTDMMDEYSKGGYYLIMEGVWWIRLDSFNGPLDGKSYCATSKGWAELLQANGYDPNTSGNLSGSQYRKLTNQCYPICMTFRESMLGLDPACEQNLATGVVNMGSSRNNNFI